MRGLKLETCADDINFKWEVAEVTYFDFDRERNNFNKEYNKLYDAEKFLLRSIKNLVNAD